MILLRAHEPHLWSRCGRPEPESSSERQTEGSGSCESDFYGENQKNVEESVKLEQKLRPLGGGRRGRREAAAPIHFLLTVGAALLRTGPDREACMGGHLPDLRCSELQPDLLVPNSGGFLCLFFYN